MKNRYYKIKLLGIFLLPVFQLSLILDGFRFSMFKNIMSFYNLLYPYVLAISILLLIVGIYNESFRINTKKISTSDKIINFVGVFYLLMNIVISLLVISIFEAA